MKSVYRTSRGPWRPTRRLARGPAISIARRIALVSEPLRPASGADPTAGGGVDWVLWTPELLGEGGPRCREREGRIRWSFGGRWWS